MKTMETETDIIIVGAGIAGLSAACELCRAGKKVMLLEGRDRTGGRINTLNDPRFQHPVELGAEFIHGRLPETFRALRRHNIQRSPVKPVIWHMENGELKRAGDMIKETSPLEKALKSVQDDMTVNEFLEAYFPGNEHEELKRSVRQFVQGYDAADPDRASVLSFRDEWMNQEWKQYRVKEGYKKLADALAGECVSNGCTIHLNTKVTAVHWGQSYVKIMTGNDRSFIAKKVLITVPLSILQAKPGSPHAIAFEPGIPEKLEAASAIGFGTVVKIVMQFREPFWQTEKFGHAGGKTLKGAGFIFSNERFPTWWTQWPDIGMLTGWAGGPPAEELEKSGEKELLQTALDSLASIFRRENAWLKQRLTAWKTYRWGNDPFSLGAYTYTTVDADRHISVLSEPLNNTVYFAGEAINDSSAVGTVEAAIASGLRAAEAMLKKR